MSRDSVREAKGACAPSTALGDARIAKYSFYTERRLIFVPGDTDPTAFDSNVTELKNDKASITFTCSSCSSEFQSISERTV